jgi:hypothetical protein
VGEAAKLFVTQPVTADDAEYGGVAPYGPIIRYDVPGEARAATLEGPIYALKQPCCLAFGPGGELFATRFTSLFGDPGEIRRLLNPDGTPQENGWFRPEDFPIDHPQFMAFRGDRLFIAQWGDTPVLGLQVRPDGATEVGGGPFPYPNLGSLTGIALNRAGEFFTSLCCGVDTSSTSGRPRPTSPAMV